VVAHRDAPVESLLCAGFRERSTVCDGFASTVAVLVDGEYGSPPGVVDVVRIPFDLIEEIRLLVARCYYPVCLRKALQPLWARLTVPSS